MSPSLTTPCHVSCDAQSISTFVAHAFVVRGSAGQTLDSFVIARSPYHQIRMVGAVGVGEAGSEGGESESEGESEREDDVDDGVEADVEDTDDEEEEVRRLEQAVAVALHPRDAVAVPSRLAGIPRLAVEQAVAVRAEAAEQHEVAVQDVAVEQVVAEEEGEATRGIPPSSIRVAGFRSSGSPPCTVT